MQDPSYQLLVDRLDTEEGLDPEAVDVVLAAAEGDEALAAHLDGRGAPERRAASADGSTPEPARVYLEQLAVENFRGVAERARLPLQPGPGLTLVVGRNGSGKSSFAEGLELLLTGENLRWADRTKVWRAGWRNLHGTGPTVLAARFRVDGEAQPLDVSRRWPPGSDLAAGEPRAVSGPRDSWEALGWEQSIERYRPLLSYNELGAMFSTRAAALYEALSSVLGLEDFDELARSIRAARLEREKSGKAEKQQRSALLAQLEPVEEPRAQTVAMLLAKRTVDLEAVETVVAGEEDADSRVEVQALATLAVPSEDAVGGALDAVRSSVDRVKELEATDAERLDALARLLSDAHAFHERHADDQTCPVCGTADVLDATWSLRTQAEAEELRRRSADLRRARDDAQAARRRLGDLFAPATPATLRAGGDAGIDTAGAHAAWDGWSELLGRDAAEVLEAGAARAAALRDALESVRAEAVAEQERRDTTWRPLRREIVAWLAMARQAARDKEHVTALKAAEAWLAELTADLRRERLRPVVEAAQENWAQLRHESNVALGKVELRKEGMQRYAAFDVTVDDTDASAFGVMSQGELSSLAVSVFLPRASLPESPFGFMVIDDPVQSMDPAKVDGLARVLGRAAEHRQVVVFTHDERLPEAVRRLQMEARIMRVQRRAKSKVEVVAGQPPSDRYIGEALALAKTADLPDEVRARVVPGFCRSAIEAACAASIRRRMLEQGTPHAQVEEALEAKTSLNTWLADVFGLSTAQGEQIRERVRKLGGDEAVEVVRLTQKGTHQLVATDGLRLAEGAKALVKAIEGR